MTAEKLKKRINNAVEELRKIVNTLGVCSSISDKSQEQIKNFDNIATSLKAIISLIDAREYALQILRNLCSQTFSDRDPNMVNYQGMKIPFQFARLLGFQSYLSITWAICDSITQLIGTFVCSDNICKNTTQPPQLWQHFLKDGNNLAQQTYFFLKDNYGLPIGISYAIRNHFLHDASIIPDTGKNFFESTEVINQFQISPDGKDWLKNKVEGNNNSKKEYGLKGYKFRSNLIQNWYDYDDLLELLELCHGELDDGLGCLIGWSVDSVTSQVKFLLERDDIS